VGALWALSLTMGVSLLVPAAQAANLLINDTVEGQITLDHDANWEFGVISNGTPFGPAVAGSTTVPGESASFSGSWEVNTGGVPDPGTGIIYIVDQGDPNLVRAERFHRHPRGIPQSGHGRPGQHSQQPGHSVRRCVRYRL
jgi:hypothetical protein